MHNRHDTIVIGAGQAGLAASWWLTRRGVDHVVLDRGRVADRWRTQRWDTFRLLSPNWQTRLPGYTYSGRDPDGFMTGAEVADFLRDYARSFAAPVHEGVAVDGLRPTDDGWAVTGTTGTWLADDVIVATGELGVPNVPSIPLPVPALHTSAYRNAAQLRPGAVLVVGAGPSGQQIARELAEAGRQVHLAVGRHKALPRRYRGRDTYWWMDRLGMLARPVSSLPGGRARRSPNAVLAGGTRDLDVPALAQAGIVVHGRLLGVSGDRAQFGDGLAATLAAAEDNAVRFRATVDAHVEATGLAAPFEEPPASQPVVEGPRELDLRAAGVTTVVWATGFRRDWSWIEAPLLGDDGEPLHDRGVTAAPGLYLLGLRWQSRRSSSFLDGVAADAEHVTAHLAARSGRLIAA
jgi:putative flavoprotein involved in K+ transport